MMTKVKKNSQRTAYTKPSYIKCAVIFREIESKVNCSRVHKTSLNRGILLSQYLNQMEGECRKYLFGGL